MVGICGGLFGRGWDNHHGDAPALYPGTVVEMNYLMSVVLSYLLEQSRGKNTFAIKLVPFVPISFF